MINRTLPASIFALLSIFSGVAAAQTVYVVSPTGSSYPLPPNFYGDNGQNRNTANWQDSMDKNSYNESFSGKVSGTKNVLASLNMGLLRFPAGTGGNYWEWQSGTFYTNYNASSPFPSPASELTAEVSESGAQPVLMLNMLTQPSATPIITSGPGTNVPQTYNLDPPDGPSTGINGNYIYGPDNQLAPSGGYISTVTIDLWGIGVPLTYIEFGNEFYLNNSDYLSVYPNDTTYGTGAISYGAIANTWIAAVHSLNSNYKCAAIGAHFNHVTRQQNWNEGLFASTASGGGNLSGEDAVTIHLYPQPNLSSGTTAPLTATDVQQLLAIPFWEYDNIAQYDLAYDTLTGNNEDGSIPKGTPLWITEYNVSDKGATTIYAGTWAHGLCLAAMSLKYLELLPDGLQMLLHHCVVADNADYPDIFSSTTALHAQSAKLTAQLWGLSAGGLVSQLINSAAKGQTSAQELQFLDDNQTAPPAIQAANNLDSPYGNPGNPGSPNTGAIEYPPLYGWEFYGSTDNQLVILNLSGSDYFVDLTQFVDIFQGSYTQISDAAPSDYVVDGERVYTNSSVASMTSAGSQGSLTATQNVSLSGTNLSQFSLPAYSITCVMIAPPAAAPVFSPAAGTYTGAQTLTITSTTSGATITYTTDGSTPTESGGTVTHGTLYSGAVSISASTTLNAIAFASGQADSPVTSGTYTITPPPTTPTPTPTPAPAPTSSGGGGALDGWFLGFLGFAGLWRWKRRPALWR